jgi:hypothetical protein
MFRRTAAVVMCWMLLIPSSGFSWGSEGHRIVAKIAAKNLSPDVRKKVEAILGTNDAGLEAAMAAAATWPDDGLDKKKTKTDLWHFVDVPIAGQFSIGHLCDGDNCVLNRIDEMSRRLQMNEKNFKLSAPPIKPRSMTSQELSFLIHFVGDVHQPLHAANNGDRGGNCEPLKTPILHTPFDTTELHAAWDDDEVRAVLKKENATEDKIALTLFNRFKMGAQVPQLTPIDWARESNELARKDVYTKLMIVSHSAPPGTCDPTIKSTMEKVDVRQPYLDGNVTDVEVQLMRAGIRLSNVLNQICAGNGCKVVTPTNGGRGGNKKKPD